MKNDLITLESLSASNLPELQGLKDKQLELVKECPFVEIVDNKSYELAKKHRTTLLKGRTSLESQDKLIASKLSAFRKDVKSVTDELILITLPHEEKQQEEVKRFEQIKENERLEKERIENERIEKIKTSISDFETKCYNLISQMTFENGLETKKELDLIFNSDFDAEEFDILYQQAKMRGQSQFDLKASEVNEKELQRKENERLAREKADADAKLEAIQKQQEKERLEREKKEREEKEKVFEVRKNRLAEIGFKFGDFGFVSESTDLFLNSEFIFNVDVVEFENILTDAKANIKKAIDQHEKEQYEKKDREKAEIEAKKKADKENKDRVKRLAKDKKQLEKSIGIVKDSFILEIVFREFGNEETENFRKETQSKIDAFFDELLTNLENL